MPTESPLLTSAEEGAVPHRDRILLLGRRKAGKTVFLARLYEQGWRGGDELHMRAREGSLHSVCMDIVAELSAGRWPAATVGSLSSGVEVTWRGRHATMVLLDYPGEVFRRAFVEGGNDEQTQTLLGHVDHAAAVILLIDPGNVHTGDVDELVDDDFGMVQAVDRIRRSAGGEDVPIAIALTKCDVHVGLVRAEGGARRFVEKHLPNLLRYGGTVRMFATSAVRTRTDAGGRAVPSPSHGPAGLIDTLVYCMRHVGRRMDADAASRQAAAAAEHQREAARRDAILVRRGRGRWVAFWVGAAVLGIALVGVAMMINSQWQTPAVSEVVEGGPVTLPLDSTPPALGPGVLGVLSGATAAAPAEDGSPLPEPGGASDGEGPAGSTDTSSTPPPHPAATPPQPAATPPPVHAPVATGDFADIYPRVSKATPYIETQCRIGECPWDEHMTPGYHGHGSGALVTLDNRLYVITNRHVIKASDEFQIVIRFYEKTDSGSVSEVIQALTFGPRDFRVHHDNVDVAWVDVSSSRDAFARGGIIPMSLSDADVRVGSTIRVLGHPGSQYDEPAHLRLTQGIVSRVFRDDREGGTTKGWMIGTDATINSGNSGGPAFDLNGDICGIAVAGLNLDGGSQNFAVHVREVKAAIAGGVPFDPSTMLLSLEDVTFMLLEDVCGAIKDWPLSQPEFDLLDVIINEHEWTPVGCQRMELAANEHASVDVGGMLAGERPDEILLLATPYNLSDTDLLVFDGQGELFDLDEADTSHAVLKVPWASVGGGLDCVVHNADRDPALVLVLVFR